VRLYVKCLLLFVMPGWRVCVVGWKREDCVEDMACPFLRGRFQFQEVRHGFYTRMCTVLLVCLLTEINWHGLHGGDAGARGHRARRPSSLFLLCIKLFCELEFRVCPALFFFILYH
jgi:hypothetical protein